MITLIERTSGSGCMYAPHAYQPVQSFQALHLERCRLRYEALLRGFGPGHRLTKAAYLMCQREAGFIISGVYSSGVKGWGVAAAARGPACGDTSAAGAARTLPVGNHGEIVDMGVSV